MKKMKVLLASILTIVMCLFCFAGCFQTGKYEAVSYKAGPITMDVSGDDASYIELKSGDVAVVSINLAVVKLEGEGTWAKGEEKGTVVIDVDGAKFTATIDGSTMTINILGTELILEK